MADVASQFKACSGCNKLLPLEKYRYKRTEKRFVSKCKRCENKARNEANALKRKKETLKRKKESSYKLKTIIGDQSCDISSIIGVLGESLGRIKKDGKL